MFICCIINVIKLIQINPNSPHWIKNKKSDNKTLSIRKITYFQYVVTVALNHEEIKKDSQRITKIKPFINKYKEGNKYGKE